MNKTFNTTTLRFTPVSALLQLQHQVNHYKNIVNPRKISSHRNSRDQQKRKTFSSHFDGKFQKQRRQSIQRQNCRIIKDCASIYKSRGILQKAEDQFKAHQEQIPKKTLINPYKAKQKVEQIRRENMNLKKKIQNLKPLIGDHDIWRKHETITNQLINKLQNKGRVQIYNTQTLARIALSSQKQKVNYMKMFKTLNFDKKQFSELQTKQTASARQKRRSKKRNKKRQVSSQTMIQEAEVQNQNEKPYFQSELTASRPQQNLTHQTKEQNL